MAIIGPRRGTSVVPIRGVRPLALMLLAILLAPGCAAPIRVRDTGGMPPWRGSPAAAVLPPLGSWGVDGPEAMRRDASLNPRREGTLEAIDAWDTKERPDWKHRRRFHLPREARVILILRPDRSRRW